MGINFEPAMPLSGFGIAESYGALQQQERNREFQFKGQQAQAQLNESAANRYQRGYEFDAAQQQQNERGQFLANQAAQQQQERFRLEGQMQSDRLTQVERIQQARLEAELGAVNDAFMNNTLNAEDADRARMMVRTRLDPYQMRAQREAADDRHQAMQQQQEMHAAQLRMAAEQERFMTNPELNIRELHAPDGSSLGLWQRTHSGEWRPISPNEGAAGSTAGTRGGHGHGTDMSDQEYIRARTAIEAAVDRAMSGPNGARRDLPAQPGTELNTPGPNHVTGLAGGWLSPDPQTRPRGPRTRDEEVHARLQAAGLATNLGEHQASRTPVAARAIPYDMPENRMTSEQRTTLGDLDQSRQRVTEAVQAGQLNDSYLDRINHAEQLMRRYGSVWAMPREARAEFIGNLSAVRRAMFTAVPQQNINPANWQQQSNSNPFPSPGG